MSKTRTGLPAGAVIGMMALLMPSCAAMAQTTTGPDPNDPCAPELGQQSPKNGDDSAKTERKDGKSTGLGDKLARCGDVLTPPKTGDTELVKPAPETGTTPVIPPKVMPKQQESDPDAK